jgi:hypothetical protein
VGDRDQSDTEDGGDESHRKVGNVGGVDGANVFEFKGAIKTPYEGSEGEEELGEWWMDINVVSCLVKLSEKLGHIRGLSGPTRMYLAANLPK